MTRSSRLILLLTALLVFGGLAPAVAATAGPANASKLPALAIPDTPAGTQLAWTLAQVNDGADELRTSDLADRFASDFLAALPASSLIAIFQDLAGPLSPVSVARFEGGVTETRARAVLTTASGQNWRVQLGVEERPPYRINDLFFEPVAVPDPVERAPKSWKGLDSRLKKVAPEVGFVAAEVTGGFCQPINEVNADQELAIASAFKLYVLGALAHEIDQGRLAWEDPLAIQQELKSLPNGEMRLEPDGARFPVRAFAEQMIANSDNTATDHLISLLGRETVEAYLPAMGHAEPDLNQPLLLTREWFALKLRYTEDELASYLNRTDASQRRLLRDQVNLVADTLGDDEVWLGPNEIETIEWFASASDLCRALAHLHGQAEQPGLAPIYDALSLNPGVPWDTTTWRYVGYKEGYETGVKSHAWLLQRADGRWFALTAIINDPEQEINGYLLRQLMVTAVDLLAKAE